VALEAHGDNYAVTQRSPAPAQTTPESVVRAIYRGADGRVAAPAIQVFGLTDRGRVRDKNEDQFLVAELQRVLRVGQSSVSGLDGARLGDSSQGWLLMVADGMGGLEHGELASSIAIEGMVRYAFAVMPWLTRYSQASEQELADAFREALVNTSQMIRATADTRGLDRRMGTTLTLAYVTWPLLHVAHVGDTRCYLFRAGLLSRLTRDHTLAERLARENALPADAAKRSQFRNVLLNAISGTGDATSVELHTLELAPGDQLLLCSDGLHGQLSDAEIAQGLQVDRPVHEIVRELTAASNAAGGGDNVTVVLARF
jgi:PPM family protein phosphatase